jgi:UDP-N-acetylglucosamine--N-acetylmuramyl-(pentapeptide) pyrophosphoryl-undecaprenol N-acetylglucosamine transferase
MQMFKWFFIEKMDFVYAAADVIISRAGASSVSELCIVAVILFHHLMQLRIIKQKMQKIIDKGAAILLKEADIDSQLVLFFWLITG